jgi:Fur family ferric uptake transcriptional regulator
VFAYRRFDFLASSARDEALLQILAGGLASMAHDEIEVAKLLQARGLRVTRQRLLILDAVCETHGHATLAEILQRVKDADAQIDRSTVHRTLAVFCELGIVSGNATATTDTVYEVAAAVPHHHLVCTVCRREIAVPHGAMRSVFDRLRDEYGFTVGAKHLMLDGVCADCGR